MLLLTCSRDFDTRETVSKVELSQDERLGLDSRFCATIQSKFLHFLQAELLCLESSQIKHSWLVREGLSVT